MKTPRFVGLMMVLSGLMLAPTMVLAQGRGREPPPKVQPQARTAGMKAAPGIVQAMGLPCQITDARMVGESKETKTSLYEVACAPGAMGYILQVTADQPTRAFSCLEVNTPPAVCLLDGNADSRSRLAPLLAKAGVSCVVADARGIGQTATDVILEVQCQGGPGYVVTTKAPLQISNEAQAQDCLFYDDADTSIKCTLVDRATRLAVVKTYAEQAKNGCVIKESRFIGRFRDGSSYFESSCEDGKGYVYRTRADGSFQEAIDCVKASSMLEGGCKFTDTRQAQTEQAALYTRLAKAAGSNCDVATYALFPPKPGEEAVELVCKDGNGAVGIFKTSGAGQVIDCARAPAVGFACSLAKTVNYGAVTADLRKVKPDATTCSVSKTGVLGKSPKGTVLLEVACADGLKGYVIEYQTTPNLSAVAATNCALAGTCKLPGNT